MGLPAAITSTLNHKKNPTQVTLAARPLLEPEAVPSQGPFRHPQEPRRYQGRNLPRKRRQMVFQRLPLLPRAAGRPLYLLPAPLSHRPQQAQTHPQLPPRPRHRRRNRRRTKETVWYRLVWAWEFLSWPLSSCSSAGTSSAGDDKRGGGRRNGTRRPRPKRSRRRPGPSVGCTR